MQGIVSFKSMHGVGKDEFGFNLGKAGPCVRVLTNDGCILVPKNETKPIHVFDFHVMCEQRIDLSFIPDFIADHMQYRPGQFLKVDHPNKNGRFITNFDNYEAAGDCLGYMLMEKKHVHIAGKWEYFLAKVAQSQQCLIGIDSTSEKGLTLSIYDGKNLLHEFVGQNRWSMLQKAGCGIGHTEDNKLLGEKLIYTQNLHAESIVYSGFLGRTNSWGRIYDHSHLDWMFNEYN